MARAAAKPSWIVVQLGVARFINPLFVNNFVDNHILDSVADGQDDAVNEIVRLVEAEEIIVLLPYSVHNELKDPQTPTHVRRAATLFPFSIKVELTEAEQHRRDAFLAQAIGDALPKNIVPDLLHVFEAAKYGGYFIARDKRLLKRAPAIAKFLDIDLVTPVEFLECVERARALAAQFGAAR